MKDRLIRLLAHPAFVPAVVFLGVALCLPSLGNGLAMDDHIHSLMVRGEHRLPWTENASPFDLFALIPGDAEFKEASVQSGISPWWGSSNYQASFWRPVSSVTLYLDHALWPDKPWLMHLQNLLWLAALLAVAALLYRRIWGGGLIAALATALYALDDAHIHPATWVANRNSLIASTLALLAILFHDKWRKQGWKAGAFMGPLCFLSGLLAGEFALAAVAYLFSYAIFLDKGSYAKRLSTLLPYAVITVSWRLVYNSLGYGVFGSDMYIDPVYSPLEFSFALAKRLPLLLLGQFGPPGSEAHVMIPEAMKTPHILLGVIFALLVVYVLWPLLKRDATARFWALGAVLSLVPVTATFLHDRLLLLAGVGAMGLVAQLLGMYLEPPDWRPKAISWRVPAIALVVVSVAFHIVLAPLSTPPRSTLVKFMGGFHENAARSIESSPEIVDQTLVIVNGPDIFTTAFMPVWRHALGLPAAGRVEVLCNSIHEITVERIDEHSIIVRVPEGHFQSWTHSLARQKSDRWDVGRRRVRPGVAYEVVESKADGEPTAIKVTFESRLEDPSLKWVSWQGQGYQKFDIPIVGDTVSHDIDEASLIKLGS